MYVRNACTNQQEQTKNKESNDKNRYATKAC